MRRAVHAAASKWVILATLASLMGLLCTTAASGGASRPAARDRVAPSAPANIRVLAATATSVKVTWDLSTDNLAVAGYYVYARGQKATVTGPPVWIDRLGCGETVAVDVVAFDRAGNRSTRASTAVSTAPCLDVEPPTAPTGFRQTVTTQNSVVLTWNASSDNVGVVEYAVYRAGLLVASTPGPAVTLTGLSCGSTYEYVVEAVDAAGNRSRRSEAWVQTAGCADAQPPSTPSDLSIVARTESSVTLSWRPSTDNVGVAAYEVTVDGAPVTAVHVPSVTLGSLVCGTTYRIGVSASDAAGNRSPQATVMATTSACPSPPTADTTPPATPASFSVTAVSITSISVAWSAATDDTGVTGYGVYVNGTRVVSTTSRTATLTGLRCGTAYGLAVDAVDAAGNRSQQAALTASTAPCIDTQPPSPPTGVTVTSRTATSIALSWRPSSDDVGVVGYGLFQNGTQIGATTETTAIFSELTCNTNYTLAVDAYDAAGNRSPKATVLVATTACPDTSPPTAPAGLAATNITQTSLTLTWQASRDDRSVAGYDVYRNGTKIASVTSTSSSQTGLSCSTSYTFGVRAFDAAGNLSPQTQIGVTTAACPTSTEWTFCASEGQHCSFSGAREVRYGASGTFTTPRVFTDGVACTNAVFGDPLPGVVKLCETRAASSNSPPTSGPITITRGGTYSGNWTSTTSTPAVRVSTTEPVTITNSTVSNSGSGALIWADAGANVTITYTVLNGGNGRAVYAYNVKTLVVRNTTITKTSGIRVDGAMPSASVTITRNKARNIQAASYNTVFAQLANVTTATIEISWNEIINTFGQSGVEDNINMFASANAKIHNNYIQGAYPPNVSAPYTGSGIMIDSGSYNNEVWENIVVDTTNAGIGIASGWNNRVHNNRIISDGRLDDGTPLAAANVGLVVWNYDNNPNWANNSAWNNVAGWVNASGQRADWWLPHCSGSCTNIPLSGTVNRAVESAEYQLWLARVAANGISIGAS